MRLVRILPLFLGATLLAESPPVMRDTSTPALIAEAKVFLAKENPEPIYKGTGKKRVLIGKETLRVTISPSGKLRLVRLSFLHKQRIVFVKTKNGKRKRTITVTELASVFPPECSAEKIGGGGVNANYRIACDAVEEIVLAGKELLTDGKPPWRSVVYIPYSDALATNDVVLLGDAHLRREIGIAVAELRRKKVYSLAVPKKLVVDVIPEEIPYLLGLIEHIDHNEYKERGPYYMMRKVLTQLGVNGPDTFLYSKSKGAGALCLMQIMPSTYREIRRLYAGAKLPTSAVIGSCSEHSLAIQVAYLVLDSKLKDMPTSFQKKFQDDPRGYGFYLAAAYNGGQARASGLYLAEQNKNLGVLDVIGNLFERLAEKKEKRALGRILREETWVFVKKYFELSNIPDANGE